VQDRVRRRAVNTVFVDAHRKATEAIKSGPGDAPVGLTVAMADFQALEGGEAKRAQILDQLEDVFLHAADGDDFVGVQSYTRTRVGPNGAVGPEEGVETTIMGYEFWPQALAACLRRAWDVTGGRTPLLVTENGVAATEDERRVAYVQQALEGVLDCLDEGIDVRGYTYWSALDNFEWAYGYGPTFGLVEVDRGTFARTPKPSARWLGEVARANALEVD
jgi:beta-glucosidase